MTMCGYCTEQAYFDWLAKTKFDNTNNTNQLPPTVDEIRLAKCLYDQEQGQALLEEYMGYDLALSKVYEHFIHHGFDQSLLDQIQKERIQIEQSYPRLYLKLKQYQLLRKQQKSNKKPKKLFIYAVMKFAGSELEVFKTIEIPSLLKQLYIAKTITNRQQWNKFINNKNGLIEASVELLERYNQWWLVGNSEQLMGKLDPIFPLLYFALVYLMKEQPDHVLIEKITFTDVERCPFFIPMDLWLQRKAFIHYLQHQGVSKTLIHFTERCNRIEMLWYAVMTFNMPESDIKLIIKMFKEHPNLIGTHGEGSAFYIEKIEAYLA